jgi:hypothetical protein
VWQDVGPQTIPLACREDNKVQPIGKQQLLTSDGELQVPQYLDQMDGVVKPLHHTLFLNVRMCDEVMRLHRSLYPSIGLSHSPIAAMSVRCDETEREAGGRDDFGNCQKPVRHGN